MGGAEEPGRWKRIQYIIVYSIIIRCNIATSISINSLTIEGTVMVLM